MLLLIRVQDASKHKTHEGLVGVANLFRTTRRSTEGAARGARTPCATSRGRWFAGS